MKFYTKIPEIQGFDTEAYHGNLKVICDSTECLEYTGNKDELLSWIVKHAEDLNFIFNLDYDFSVILKPFMPEIVEDMKSKRKKKEEEIESGQYFYKGVEIKYISNKAFIIKNKDKHGKKKILRFYDIAQFYKDEKGFSTLDKVSKEYLGIGKNNEELQIDRKAIGEVEGYYEAHRQSIIKYCMKDAYLARELAKQKVSSIHKFLGVIPKAYYSNASISKSYLELKHPDISLSYYKMLLKLPENQRIKAHKIMLNSFFGGLFYVHKFGKSDNVYEYDLNSSYPANISKLYSLKDAEIRTVKELAIDADYSFYLVRIRNLSDLPIHYRTGKQEITYIKSNDFVENYFSGIELQYFTEKHSHDIHFEVVDGIAIYTTKQSEFADFKELYSARSKTKSEGKELKNLSLPHADKEIDQWNLKIVLNATYGTTAEKQHGFTKWSNYIYASYITAQTRIKIYEAIDKIGWNHTIMVMTDAIVSDKPIDDPDYNTDKLGKFKLEGKFDTLWVYQNGVYIARIGNKMVLHNRGFPTLLDPNMLLNATGDKISIKRKAPLKVKEAITQARIDEMANFVSKNKTFSLESNRWKYLIDSEKLTFENLKDNPLISDYLFNVDLQNEFTDKPKLLDLQKKSLKKWLIQTEKWKEAISIKKPEIEPLDAKTIVEGIEHSLNTKNWNRDLKRTLSKYEGYPFFKLKYHSNGYFSVSVNDETFIFATGL